MPEHASTKPDGLTLVAFGGLVVAAGGNAPAIRYVSCEGCELDPFWSAAMRFGLAALVFLIIASARRVGIPRGRALRGAILFGVLQFGAGFGLIYWGLVRAPAGLSQVLLASVPLLTFGLALAHRLERFRWTALAGATLAIAGSTVVFGSGLSEGVPAASMIAILGGAVCWSEAFVVLKRSPKVHPAALNAIGMSIGALILIVLAAVFDEAFLIPSAASTLNAQAYLVLVGSVGVFWLYAIVLRGWTASAASYQMVLIPLVTVAVSAWLHGEDISGSFAIGSLLVLAGVYVGVLWRRSPRTAASAGSAAGVKEPKRRS